MIVFADFERKAIIERTNAGLAAAKARGVQLGRRRKLSTKKAAILRQAVEGGLSKAEAAKRFRIGRTTVYRFLAEAA